MARTNSFVAADIEDDLGYEGTQQRGRGFSMSGRGILRLLAAVLLLAGVRGLSAGRQDVPRILGILAVKGDVRVDRQPVPSGTAFFAGDVITTGQASAAVMNFHSGTLATLSEGAEVAVPPDALTPGLRLTRGAVAIRSEESQGVRIAVPGADVMVRGESGYPAVCRVALLGTAAGIFAQRGRVEIHGQGSPLVLAPGKSIQLEAGRPQVAGQHAGKVSNAIPDEVLQPQGKGTEIPLKVSDSVNWEDVVKTLRTGRVRLLLDDGSTLNVGARSVMRITKHDAQSQQTEVELQLGRLRGEVVKITKPGGSFQVKTNTAVIGVVGTIFTAQALRSLTRVSCLEGSVSVRNINPAIVGETTLHAGQSTSVALNAPPSSAISSSVSQAVSEVGRTGAGEPLSGQMTQALQSLGATPGQINAAAMGVRAGAQAGAAGGQAAGVAAHLTPNVVNGIVTGTGVASAAMGGAAISRAGSARDTAAAANALLSTAASTNQQAASTSQAAADTETAVSNGLENLIQQLSPGGPGCGCLP
ncbi:MAG: FecR family protein [Acidobacteriia bacterium]|nr:FecR family protein [Terriglobia bacterium]